jgi:hypothetical protein
MSADLERNKVIVACWFEGFWSGLRILPTATTGVPIAKRT